MSALTITQLVECAEPWVKYIAADSNGAVWFYESEPVLLRQGGCFITKSRQAGRFERLHGMHVIPWYSDWNNSIIKRSIPITNEHIGKLCLFWNKDNCEDAELDLLVKVATGDTFPYSTASTWYKYCRLATKVEALSLVVE